MCRQWWLSRYFCFFRAVIAGAAAAAAATTIHFQWLVQFKDLKCFSPFDHLLILGWCPAWSGRCCAMYNTTYEKSKKYCCDSKNTYGYNDATSGGIDDNDTERINRQWTEDKIMKRLKGKLVNARHRSAATLRRAGTAAGTPFINCAVYNSRLVEPFAVKGFTSFECQPRSSSMNKWRNGQLRYSMRRYVYRPLLLRCRRWFFSAFRVI